MHRLIVIILAAVDAAIAAAVGIAASLAPLTLLWVLGMGDAADWSTLWPASAAVWHLGNLVPLQVTLPGDYLAVTGIDPGAASFVLSLAPLAFASFTAIFAARSGVRASQADAWITGAISGSVVFAVLTALIAMTSANPLAEAERWQAILFPALVYAVPLLIGAVITEWREAGSGSVARWRDRVEGVPNGWGSVPGLIVRGTAVVLVGLIGLGAVGFAAALALRGGEVIALFEAAHVDALGATVVTLAQLAYLPTLIVWCIAFIAGPGFAVGAGTAVSPAGTQLGVIPGIPVLGVLPESTTSWLLLLALLPVAVGALAGWIARSRMVSPAGTSDPRGTSVSAVLTSTPDNVTTASSRVGPGTLPGASGRADPAAPDNARTAALAALLAGDEALRSSSELEDGASVQDDAVDVTAHDDPVGPRFVIAVGIAVLSGAGAGLLALLASGSIGPGRLAEVGPQPGAVALAVGVEALLGAGILLLSPRRRAKRAPAIEAGQDATPAVAEDALSPSPSPSPLDDRDETVQPAGPDPATATTWAVDADPDTTPTADLGPRRPRPLPPVD